MMGDEYMGGPQHGKPAQAHSAPHGDAGNLPGDGPPLSPAAEPAGGADAPAEKDTGAAARRARADTQQARASRGLLVALLFSIGLVLASLLYGTGTRLARRQPAARVVLPTLAAEPPAPDDALGATEVMAAVAPSVVSISLYEEAGITAVSSGSGVVLTADGYIATNAHVVHGAPVIRVSLYNGMGYVAQLVASDAASDLAILKVNASNLVPATLGNSDHLQVGQRLYIIGNATGSLPGSISQGIVSGLQRNVPISTTAGEVVRMNLIQTDAAVNPGNSGGAAANSHGQVVGICIGKVESENVENVGFVLPINKAMQTLGYLMQHGVLPSPARLGVITEPLNETTGPPNGLPETGLYIRQLTPGSSLGPLGILPGDVLMEADGVELLSNADLAAVLEKYYAGEEIEIVVYRLHTGATQRYTAQLYEG